MSAAEFSAAPAGDASRPAHRALSLTGVAPDGSLLLTDGDGGTYSLAVDGRVRAALTDPNQPAAPARREPTMPTQSESMLRPRDIQTRIRAGESPEQVAAAAQTSVERVMPFAGPVLAEREHVAERAQKSSIRRPAGSTVPEGGPRTLGDVVAARIRGLGLDPTDLVTWDSWRREDGRWTLTGRFAIHGAADSREGLARFTFDPPGNFVTLEDDDARWLVGDLAPEPAAAPPRPGVRRLAAVHDRSAQTPDRSAPDADQLSIDDELGLDAVGLVADSPVEAFLDDHPGADESGLVEEAADAAALDRDHEPPRRRPVRKNRGRASVPSWDEIMFGGPDQ